MLRRTGVPELAELGRSLVEAHRSDSDVTETLRRFAQHHRMADVARVRTWAKRAPIHVAFVQAILMLPSAAMILVGPALIRAMKSLAALMGG
jgi:elongation factor P--beta-lysine ligase